MGAHEGEEGEMNIPKDYPEAKAWLAERLQQAKDITERDLKVHDYKGTIEQNLAVALTYHTVEAEATLRLFADHIEALETDKAGLVAALDAAKIKHITWESTSGNPVKRAIIEFENGEPEDGWFNFNNRIDTAIKDNREATT